MSHIWVSGGNVPLKVKQCALWEIEQVLGRVPVPVRAAGGYPGRLSTRLGLGHSPLNPAGPSLQGQCLISYGFVAPMSSTELGLLALPLKSSLDLTWLHWRPQHLLERPDQQAAASLLFAEFLIWDPGIPSWAAERADMGKKPLNLLRNLCVSAESLNTPDRHQFL